MNTVRRRKHSSLYYRNTLFAWGFAAFILVVALFIPNQYAKLVWLILGFLLNSMVWGTYHSIHPIRMRAAFFSPADFNLPHEKISFLSRDKLQLAAWYVPAKNRAAVILVHGAGGNKDTMVGQARLLAADGFGVLALDLRAHGESEGDTINGIDEANDVLGALDYLKTRPDVEAEKVGALGISLGAVVVLRAARLPGDLHAVILESLGPVSLNDHGGPPKTLRRKINYPFNWFNYNLGNWMCGVTPTESVTEALPRLWPRPVMLISTGKRLERHFNRIFFEAAHEPKTIWEATRATHAAAYYYEKETYKEKVCEFFRNSLLGEAGS